MRFLNPNATSASSPTVKREIRPVPLLTYGLLELGIAVTAVLVPVSLALVRKLQISIFGGVDEPPAA